MRKKFLLCFCIALFAAGTLAAQLSLNPAVAATFSRYNESFDDKTLNAEVGYRIGLNLRIGNKFYIAPGFHYFKFTTQVESVDLDEDGKPDQAAFSRDLDYRGFQFPLMIGTRVLGKNEFQLRLFGGPSGTYVLTDDDDTLVQLGRIHIEDFLWALTAGLGFDLGIATLDIQHEWMLNDTFSSDQEIDNRNNLFVISFGLKL